MESLLRDIVLSYAPEELRRLFRPASTERLRIIALVSGLLQCVTLLVWLLVDARKFMALQYSRLSSAVPLDENFMSTFIFFISYLLYPASIVRIYFIAEGAFRWLLAFLNGDSLPSGPFVLGWKAFRLVHRRRSEKIFRETALKDKVESFENGNRLMISSSFPRPHWNESITISIRDENYEVEKNRPGMAPYAYLYVLRKGLPDEDQAWIRGLRTVAGNTACQTSQHLKTQLAEISRGLPHPGPYAP